MLRLVERSRPDVRQVLHIEHDRRTVVGIDERILIYRLSGGNTRFFRRAQIGIHSRHGKKIFEVGNDRDRAAGSSYLAEWHSSLASLFQNRGSRIEVHAALWISQVRRCRDVLLCEQVASKASEVRELQHASL